MRKVFGKRIIEAGIVFGVALIPACNSTQQRVAVNDRAENSRTSSTRPSADARAVVQSVVETRRPAAGVQAAIVSPYQPCIYAAPAAEPTPQPKPMKAEQTAPLITVAASRLPGPETPAPLEPSPPVAELASFEVSVHAGTPQSQVSAAQPLDEPNQQEIRLSSAAVASGKAGLSHAADYSWLAGELQYIQSRDSWRLRYAPVDEEDRYGGTVTLMGDQVKTEWKDGQMVRVEGNLINPESRTPRSPFWVRSIQLLKPAPNRDD